MTPWASDAVRFCCQNQNGWLYSHRHNWLALLCLMGAGASIRQFFVRRHGYKLGRQAHPWPFALLGLVPIAAVVLWLRPAPDAIDSIAASARSTGGNGQNDYQAVQAVLARRCYLCHGAQVQMKGVRLDAAEHIRRHAPMVYQQVVLMRQMPLNNATQMTEAERQTVRQWFEAGARVDETAR